MKIFIFFSLFLVASAGLDAQKEAPRFYISLMKHYSLRDADIIHDDYTWIFANGTVAHRGYFSLRFLSLNLANVPDYELEDINSRTSEEVKSFGNTYKSYVKYSEGDWAAFWETHIAKFRPDGLLELKSYTDNKKSSTYLAIQDEYIEGGYKFYRFIKY
ncbi:unnamed protein product [Caenorhabditis angaria]|uniref:DUF38 domain-containing protein n=1 Tax=Caenorhabditis angaria TaxID=860376 RepID=A0A9P1ICT1_9PELO|nr:unnamed protein product [Caenorhabditis angaria]